MGMRKGTGDKPEKELQQPNLIVLSDDEGGPMQTAVDQCLGETLRFYDRAEVQEIIATEEGITATVSPNKDIVSEDLDLRRLV